MTETIEQVEENAIHEIEQQHYLEIQECEKRCYELETKYETDNAASKASKKLWEQAIQELRSCIRRGPDPQQQLDFPEQWREVEIHKALNLTDAQLEKLYEANITNVEEFEDLRAGKRNDYPNGLSDLPGVGQATIDKWEAEIIDWLTKNQSCDEEE